MDNLKELLEKWYATEEQWNDWRWQISNRITNVDKLSQFVHLTPKEKDGIAACLKKFRMAITPYYASLIKSEDRQCPIRMQAVPNPKELVCTRGDMRDPLHEDVDSPVPGLTHRYPDRVLLLVTDCCSMYCRHCTRRRIAGQNDRSLPKAQLDRAFSYIRSNPTIRDVVISGGDPFTLADEQLEYILKKLRAIKHVEVIRFGTRTPVVLPQRITPELCNMLEKYHPVWINTHFNHPREITPASSAAVARLAKAGIPVNNQSVLLKGINDRAHIMKKLVQGLLKIRIRPYYLYQCDLSEGIGHFRTSVSTGIEIMENLRGHTSGLAVPTYVIDAPGGGGKIPIGPNYLLSQGQGKTVLRNFEGKVYLYTEPDAEEGKNTTSNLGIAGLMQSNDVILNTEEKMIIAKGS
ncbi:L-lysine 2,3-aminomutase [Desulforamulus reducens MI-1]|uniref:L-lysine 2,3-aminomutase n=1 Tax=Desulforamulus reducens (strain ATCC BAA-1160 / DSM 100696 / MI-1) TaxID=349161 RepID=A4J2H6_DESRM|nr:lysine 2,3-aminomutase [Desulforamulus reducens]ABO49279.1 L-lysine 2,3-aminomutase [Desulforamulus reducens MI-1]